MPSYRRRSNPGVQTMRIGFLVLVGALALSGAMVLATAMGLTATAAASLPVLSFRATRVDLPAPHAPGAWYDVWTREDGAPARLIHSAPAPPAREDLLSLPLPPALPGTGTLEVVVYDRRTRGESGRGPDGDPRDGLSYSLLDREPLRARFVLEGASAPEPPDLRQPDPVLAVTNAHAWPNPVNPLDRNVVLEFELSRPADLTLDAYNWAGDHVATVFQGQGVAGTNNVFWGCQAEDGTRLAAGVYFVRVVASTGARKEPAVIKVAVWYD